MTTKLNIIQTFLNTSTPKFGFSELVQFTPWKVMRWKLGPCGHHHVWYFPVKRWNSCQSHGVFRGYEWISFLNAQYRYPKRLIYIQGRNHGRPIQLIVSALQVHSGYRAKASALLNLGDMRACLRPRFVPVLSSLPSLPNLLS